MEFPSQTMEFSTVFSIVFQGFSHIFHIFHGFFHGISISNHGVSMVFSHGFSSIGRIRGFSSQALGSRGHGRLQLHQGATAAGGLTARSLDHGNLLQTENHRENYGKNHDSWGSYIYKCFMFIWTMGNHETRNYRKNSERTINGGLLLEKSLN